MIAFAVSTLESPTRFGRMLSHIPQQVQIDGRKIILHAEDESSARKAVADAGFTVVACRQHDNYVDNMLAQCDEWRRSQRRAA